jgi:hypothetical protein
MSEARRPLIRPLPGFEGTPYIPPELDDDRLEDGEVAMVIHESQLRLDLRSRESRPPRRRRRSAA